MVLGKMYSLQTMRGFGSWLLCDGDGAGAGSTTWLRERSRGPF